VVKEAEIVHDLQTLQPVGVLMSLYNNIDNTTTLYRCPIDNVSTQVCTPILQNYYKYKMTFAVDKQAKKVYYMLKASDIAENTSLFIYNATDGSLQQITGYSGQPDPYTEDTADSTGFYFSTYDANTSTAYIYHIGFNGGTPTLVMQTSSSGSADALTVRGQYVVFEFYDPYGYYPLIGSALKDGSQPQNLVVLSKTPSGPNCSLGGELSISESVQTDYVLYTCDNGTARYGCYVKADGTGRQCPYAEVIRGSAVGYSYLLDGVPTITSGRALAVDNSSQLISVDLTLPGQSDIVLGSLSQGQSITAPPFHIGGGEILVQVFNGTSDDVYRANLEVQGSLSAVSTDMYYNERPVGNVQ
jgi:hypothetical protein